ncbi:ATP-binding protein [Anabaena sp. UHCC 0187]|uniref:ATP-dependent nuclease n=1 Tax=Anabaena sp. UHCC 0187 TaxID=2590018 RepID=UPI001447A9CC|nr:ATP-binding protein [Anabaena sp. UHCC 0187]MTJ15281.1 ATP-binding protein [Anabaena sp. UHCC 0187]
MKITKIELTNIRSYENSQIELSPGINIIIGENNSGKTTILRTLLFLQNSNLLQANDIRKNEYAGTVKIKFKDCDSKHFHPNLWNTIGINYDSVIINIYSTIALHICGETFGHYGMQNSNSIIFNEEPNNFIYPFLSKRKVETFNEDVRQQATNSVLGNFYNLTAKVDRISTDNFPAKKEYVKACDEILGFPINSLASPSGKKASYIVNNFGHIPIESMGEGVANILGLILDLCIADNENKLFLIEEPENDIHPKALKKLLDFIIEKSKTNQFIITTHSNIVLKYLGSAPESKVFQVKMDFVNKVPTSTITEINNTHQSRKEILEDLGYELFDFDIWDTWLILEESSAETVIRDFLIPNFVPKLQGRLKTCSSKGVDKVRARIEALTSLCLFLHLQDSFKDRIWVLIDGGENEEKIIRDLKNSYKSWNEDHFLQLKEHEFENYYPEEFKDEVLKIKDSEDKRESKRVLLKKVKQWWIENPEDAKESFCKSAYEIIEILQNIEDSLNKINY